MAITGGCHCGAIRYEIEGEALTHALCHCTDCRRCAGAPPAIGAMTEGVGQGLTFDFVPNRAAVTAAGDRHRRPPTFVAAYRSLRMLVDYLAGVACRAVWWTLLAPCS